MRLNPHGHLQWAKTYDVDGGEAEVYALESGVDSHGNHGLVLAGRTHLPFDALAFRTDVSGNVWWANRFPPAYSESFSFGEMIVAKDDFGYAMAGRAFDYTPAGTGYDFQLIQMDEAGQTPSACYEKALVKATTVEWCQERLKPLSLDAVDEMTVTPDWQPLSITDTTCS